jgi:tetratricopeptide (TPR) repeat protein
MLFQDRGPGDLPRFFMLETIREYAAERLAQSGEAEILCDRHLAYFLALGEAMEPGFRREDQLLFLEQTDAEMGNFRSAFEWAMSTEQVEAAARLVSSIDYYFRYRDGTAEGYRWTQHVIRRLEEVPPARQIRFLVAAARLAWQSGNVQDTRVLARQGLALARREGDRHAQAWLLVELGMSVFSGTANRRAYEEANGQYEEAIAIFRDFDDRPGLAYALNAYSIVLRAGGEHERASDAQEAALALCYETGEVSRQSMLLSGLAYAAYLRGDYEHARDVALASLRQRMDLGLRLWFLVGLAGLAGPLGKLGRPQEAARLLGASAAMLETMGMPYPPSDRDEVALYVTDIRSQLDEEAFAAAWAEGQAMSMAEAVAYVLEEAVLKPQQTSA